MQTSPEASVGCHSAPLGQYGYTERLEAMSHNTERRFFQYNKPPFFCQPQYHRTIRQETRTQKSMVTAAAGIV